MGGGYEVMQWDIQIGERLPRKELHDAYGGNRQRGISPSRRSPNVLLFSDLAASAKHGYADNLEGHPVLYYGEGQFGDQEMTHGNRAILRHEDDKRALRLFRVYAAEVEYLGEFELDGTPYEWVEAPDTSGKATRKALVFRLVPSDSASRSRFGTMSASE